MNSSKGTKPALSFFTTMEIVLMAMLAAANAAMSLYLTSVNQMLNSLGGPIATSTITGLYMVYGLLAVYIIRKPGTAVITYGIGAVAQSFIGTAYGMASAFAAAACYMVIVEIVFALLRYRKWNTGVMMLAGAVMVPLWFYFAAHMFGYTKWDLNILLIALVVRMLSGAVLCGLLTKWIGEALIRSGLLRSFAAARREEA
ncbi:ECF transporter S component [Paenibacillus caui]|uniref:ECF transporter S component n=1 Tax=Paenibacillus caui TaxID=2873927 RepID=UPI001CA961A8|nr:ECF transporter S component [Paenibacillus caui]